MFGWCRPSAFSKTDLPIQMVQPEHADPEVVDRILDKLKDLEEVREQSYER